MKGSCNNAGAAMADLQHHCQRLPLHAPWWFFLKLLYTVLTGPHSSNLRPLHAREVTKRTERSEMPHTANLQPVMQSSLTRLLQSNFGPSPACMQGRQSVACCSPLVQRHLRAVAAEGAVGQAAGRGLLEYARAVHGRHVGRKAAVVHPAQVRPARSPGDILL